MKPIYQLVIPAVMLTLLGCSDDDKESSVVDTSGTVIETKFDGIWLSEPYGKGLKISNGSIEAFDYTTNFCLLDFSTGFDTESQLNDFLSMSSQQSEIYLFSDYGTSEFHAPTPPYVKYSQLPASCSNGYEKKVGENGYSRDPMKNVKIFFESFKEYYLDFGLSNTDWNAVYESAISGVDATTSDEELFEIFYQAILNLNDTHVSISSGSIGTASINNKPVFWEVLLEEFMLLNNLGSTLPVELTQAANEYIDDSVNAFKQITASYAEEQSSITTFGDDALMWFQSSNIGYLAINKMAGLSPDLDLEGEIGQANTGINKALGELADTDALIVDVRFNNGGFDAVSMMYAKHLITNGGILASKEVSDHLGNMFTLNYELEPSSNAYTKPIFILTSASTVSAAEVFVLLMKSQPNVIIVGENTQGSLSDALEKSLPNGFKFNLSNEKYLSADGQWYEKSGIPADVEVPFLDYSSRQVSEDLAIEAVISLLD